MNLLLVEAEEKDAAMMAAELRARGHDVAIAATGAAALQAVDGAPFDAVVIARRLPLMDGVAVVRRLRESGKMLPVAMLGESGGAVEALEAGADDHLARPPAPDELDARLRALLRARQWATGAGDTLRVGDIVVSPSRFRAWRAERPLELVRLELRLLAELARNPGTVLTRATLVARVWEQDSQPATNIVDVQIRALRRKLTAGGEGDPIVTVRGVGYMLRD